MQVRIANQLIVIGLLIMAGGCGNVTEVMRPADEIRVEPLDNAVAVFRRAESLGAASVAPKSYQKTTQALNHMNAVVQLEPGNELAIQNAVERFAFEAEHLLHITEEVNELRSVQSHALENVILSAEYRLLAISDALKQPDPRRQKLYDQTVGIANAATRIASQVSTQNTGSITKRHLNRSELDEAYTKIKQLNLQLKNLEKDKSQFEKDSKRLNKRISSLELLVLELNEKNAGLGARLKQVEQGLEESDQSAE